MFRTLIRSLLRSASLVLCPAPIRLAAAPPLLFTADLNGVAVGDAGQGEGVLRRSMPDTPCRMPPRPSLMIPPPTRPGS